VQWKGPRSAPPLGFPRETDSLCPTCVKEVRNAVISGTYYVTVPEGAGAIVFEDPRLGLMMAAPSRKGSAPRELESQISETPKAGTLFLWESWLRHEVPLNRAVGNRISVSFNYCLG
jgi:uncharacterized protein (TIGR02466 family)